MELTEKEQAYVEWRARGLGPHAAALKAGYARSTARAKSHRLEQRLPIQTSIAEQRKLLTRHLLNRGVDIIAFSNSLKEGLKRGSAASARLWLEIFDVLPNKRERKLTAALIKKIMVIVKPFVEPSKLPELASKFAKAVDD